MNKRGFTLIEMTIVLLIVGILANIAIPFTHKVRQKADAARVIGDYKAVQAAVLGHFAETQEIPRSRGWGRVPPELVSLLPNGFDFRHGEVRYRWRRWGRPNGTARRRGRSQQVIMGLQITTRDRDLMKAIKGLYAGPLAFGTATRVTFTMD